MGKTVCLVAQRVAPARPTHQETPEQSMGRLARRVCRWRRLAQQLHTGVQQMRRMRRTRDQAESATENSKTAMLAPSEAAQQDTRRPRPQGTHSKSQYHSAEMHANRVAPACAGMRTTWCSCRSLKASGDSGTVRGGRGGRSKMDTACAGRGVGGSRSCTTDREASSDRATTQARARLADRTTAFHRIAPARARQMQSARDLIGARARVKFLRARSNVGSRRRQVQLGQGGGGGAVAVAGRELEEAVFRLTQHDTEGYVEKVVVSAL